MKNLLIRKHYHRPSSFSSQKGQMAIFVALIFQLLFVLFAMSLNVALVVHDKINLQNSVDLAAYYAAQKQAEILNVIAHTNYQIRQSWKLLSWRYRVLSTLGRTLDSFGGRNPSPKNPNHGNDKSNSAYLPLGSFPVSCVSHSLWNNRIFEDDFCRKPQIFSPSIINFLRSPITIVAAFNPINFYVHRAFEDARAAVRDLCSTQGAHNYLFAARILKAFREDQKNRKQLIRALVKNLNRHRFRDISGNSVAVGARNTMEKNLTHGNKDLNAHRFRIYNSLAGLNGRWLQEINILPVVYFADIVNSQSCQKTPKPVSFIGSRGSLSLAAARAFLRSEDPQGALQANVGDGAVLRSSDPYSYSLGFEKNPWYMAYVGVKADTKTRQLFFPFGKQITLNAQAFAKPFGGRIGPWYGKNWTHGARFSSGDPIDKLLPQRVINNNFSSINRLDIRNVPNFSRYPGDLHGLNSKQAQTEILGINTYLGIKGYYRPLQLTFKEGLSNDILPWNQVQNVAPDIREYELAAIAPDLFDLAYYSIAPNFNTNYLAKLKHSKQRLGLPPDFPIRGDLGSRDGTLSSSIQDVISRSQRRYGSNIGYKIKDKKHLLADWLPGSGRFIGSPASPSNFGKCKLTDRSLRKSNPGSCVAEGGRSGYSVKLISIDALISGQFALGGNGQSGQIANPPTDF